MQIKPISSQYHYVSHPANGDIKVVVVWMLADGADAIYWDIALRSFHTTMCQIATCSHYKDGRVAKRQQFQDPNPSDLLNLRWIDGNKQ